MNEDLVFIDSKWVVVTRDVSKTITTSLHPDVKDWLVEHIGPYNKWDTDYEAPCWGWKPLIPNWQGPRKAVVFISDPTKRLLFKLTWGGV